MMREMTVAEAHSQSPVGVMDRFIQMAASTTFEDGLRADLEVRRAARQLGIEPDQFLALVKKRVDAQQYPAHQLRCMDKWMKWKLRIGEKPQEIVAFEDDLERMFAEYAVV